MKIELANYDFPYHDYHLFSSGVEPVSYQVGQDNRDAAGSQKKLFVSKSTLIIPTGDCTVKFNDSDNVTITLLANQMYTFYSNIHTLIVVTIASQMKLYAYFEGVLPEEARSPE